MSGLFFKSNGYKNGKTRKECTHSDIFSLVLERQKVDKVKTYGFYRTWVFGHAEDIMTQNHSSPLLARNFVQLYY